MHISLEHAAGFALVGVQRGDDGCVCAALFHVAGTEPPRGFVRRETGDHPVDNLHSIIKHGGWEDP